MVLASLTWLKVCFLSSALMPVGCGWTNSTSWSTTRAPPQTIARRQWKFTSKNYKSTKMGHLRSYLILSCGSAGQSIPQAFRNIIWTERIQHRDKWKRDWKQRELTWETIDFSFYKDKSNKFLRWNKNRETLTSQVSLNIWRKSSVPTSLLKESRNAAGSTGRRRSKSMRRDSWWSW